MKQIKLSQGKIAIIDDCYFDKVIKHKWYADKIGRCFYAKTRIYDGLNKKGRTEYLHRFILGVDKEIKVDHIDGNPLNNKIENLRVCTQGQNMHNTRSHIDSTSKYKGVYWDKSRNKWSARICLEYKIKFLGRFKNEEEAALAYNDAAKKLHGDFANINTILIEKRYEYSEPTNY